MNMFKSLIVYTSSKKFQIIISTRYPLALPQAALHGASEKHIILICLHLKELRKRYLSCIQAELYLFSEWRKLRSDFY